MIVGTSLAMSFLNYDTFATHVSKPIITMDRQSFGINENIVVKGWVEYQNDPASDVLLDTVINEPEGDKLTSNQIRSDETGNLHLTLL